MNPNDQTNLDQNLTPQLDRRDNKPQTPSQEQAPTPSVSWPSNQTQTSSQENKYPPFQLQPLIPEPIISPIPLPTVPSSSKKPGSFKIFFIVIALILFGVLVGVVAARFLPTNTFIEAPSSQSPQSNITPSETITSIVDETASWQIYQKPGIDFTFKYPSDYTLTENNPKPKETGPWSIGVMSPLTLNDSKRTTVGPKELKIEIYIEPQKDNETLTEFFNAQARTDGNPLGPNTKTIVAGIEAIKLNWEGMGNGTSYYLLFNKKRITITKYPQVSERDKEFNQFFSTFKFVESTISTQTKYTCPATEWVDCMPGPDIPARPFCEPDFLVWAKENCPNFKGAAL